MVPTTSRETVEIAAPITERRITQRGAPKPVAWAWPESSAVPRVQGRGNLFGWELKNNRSVQHRFVSTLDYNYWSNPGFIYGGTSTVQQIISRFSIGEKTNIVTLAVMI